MEDVAVSPGDPQLAGARKVDEAEEDLKAKKLAVQEESDDQILFSCNICYDVRTRYEARLP